MTIEEIARICHEVNRIYCQAIGDNSQLPWENAPDWQRESAIKGVLFRIDNPDAPVSAQHGAWMEDKIKSGWTRGPIKDETIKQHPCIRPFDELPKSQQVKDYLFMSLVNNLARNLT